MSGVVADAQSARQVFTASSEDVGNCQPNLSKVFGPGSVFGLDGSQHRRRRRLLAPPFHGKNMVRYEQIIEEETLCEMANWVEGEQFPILEPMMRITLNAILRAVFGADGEELEALRRLLPPWVALGSRLRRYTFQASSARAEKYYARGVAYAPKAAAVSWCTDERPLADYEIRGKHQKSTPRGEAQR